MAVTLEQINRNLDELRRDVAQIKEYLKEDYELSDDLKREIQEAKKTPRSKFISHDEVMKRYS